MQLIQWNYNWEEERVMINQLNLQRFPTAVGYRPWLDTHTTPTEKVPEYLESTMETFAFDILICLN